MKVKPGWIFLGLLIGFLSVLYWDKLDTKLQPPKPNLVAIRPIDEKILSELESYHPAVLGVETASSSASPSASPFASFTP